MQSAFSNDACNMTEYVYVDRSSSRPTKPDHRNFYSAIMFLSKKKCKTLACVFLVAAAIGILYRSFSNDTTNDAKSRRQDHFGSRAIVNDHQDQQTNQDVQTTIESKENRIQRIEKEQNKRKNKIQEICAKRRANRPKAAELYDDTLRHIYVVDKYKLMFCYIPKVGCSNWKRILMILEDHSRTIGDIDSREAHSRNKLTVLRRYTESQRDWRLRTYRKFLFVRHPLSRIVSAYKNKYKDLSVFRVAPIVLRRYAMRIMKKYRTNPTLQELETGENITWTEWLQYLSDPTEQDRFDRHWKEMYKLCSPCAMNYDFVGKLEYINEEADYIMDKLDISRIIRYPGKENSHPTNSTVGGYERMFQNATPFELKRIAEIYNLDFQLFGYYKPEMFN